MGFAKVIIIGGGFGGLNAAKNLAKAPVDILLLDKTNHHLFQPLLYQVATATISPGNIAAPLREILAKQDNTTILLAHIAKVDKERKEVIAGNEEVFKYDYLIIATGARHSYFGHPEWEEKAPGLKTINDALRIRDRVLISYERAERSDSLTQAMRFLRFIIIGGGPTGVELAGAIGEIAHKTLISDFKHFKSQHSRIYLIEGTGQILPSFPKVLADKAQEDLEKLGVEVLLKTMVTNVTSEGVWIGEKFLEGPNIFWAAGNEASKLIKTLNIPLDRMGRAIVNPDLTIPDHPEIFVIGDAACCQSGNGNPLPGIAPVAIQQGKYVANIIKSKISPDQRKPFVYRDKGMMATIGKAKAIAVIKNIKISGFVAWLSWCFIHLLYIVSFTNRTHVILQWFNTFITNKRRVRIITRPVSDNEESLHKDL